MNQEQFVTEMMRGFAGEFTKALSSVTSSVLTSSYLSNIRALGENDAHRFDAWAGDLEKYFLVADPTEQEKCRVALLTSKGSVGSLIRRLITGNAQLTWDDLKLRLREHYGLERDPHQYLVELARIQQYPQERLEVYLERILNLAERAYGGDRRQDPLVQKQVKDFFVEGLRDPEIKLAVIRADPATLDRAYNLARGESKLRARVVMSPHRSEDFPQPMEVCHARRLKYTQAPPRPEYRRPPPPPDEKRHVNRRTPVPGPCWVCGDRSHIARNCST